MATIMLAAPYANLQARSGVTYMADGTGYIGAVAAGDVLDLVNEGASAQVIRSNHIAVVDPVATNDAAHGYAPGSRWVNLTSGLIWECAVATTNAAIWMPITVRFIGRLLAANMNSSADQAIPLFLPATATFRLTKITAKNASTSLTTAAGGVYTAASKGGTAMVAAGQVYTALTAATLALDLTIVSTPGNTVLAAGTPLFLSLSTPQGGAATADLYLYGDIYL